MGLRFFIDQCVPNAVTDALRDNDRRGFWCQQQKLTSKS